MRIWTGKLRLLGRATRYPDGARENGEEVTARVIVIGGDALHIDIWRDVDGLGNPRWRAVDPREFDMLSVFRALAMTQPEQEKA